MFMKAAVTLQGCYRKSIILLADAYQLTNCGILDTAILCLYPIDLAFQLNCGKFVDNGRCG